MPALKVGLSDSEAVMRQTCGPNLNNCLQDEGAPSQAGQDQDGADVIQISVISGAFRNWMGCATETIWEHLLAVAILKQSHAQGSLNVYP